MFAGEMDQWQPVLYRGTTPVTMEIPKGNLRESLQNMHAPGIIADREAVLEVFRRFREMEHRGARIMYGHDPDFWKDVPQAPVRLG
jgi:hypothetical protein